MLSKTVIQNQARRNFMASLALLGILLLICATLGYALLGSAVFGFILLTVWLVSLWLQIHHPTMALRSMGALPLSVQQAPGLYLSIRHLAIKGGLPTIPRLYYIPTSQLNAVATGDRTDPAIAVTDGLLRHLNQREIIGVLAHEMAHIVNGDMHWIRISNSLQQCIALMARTALLLVILALPFCILGWVQISLGWLWLMILAPVVAALLNLGVSRIREFEADRKAVEICEDPFGLASALNKMQSQQYPITHYFKLPEILRTHPITRERIQRLLNLCDSRALVFQNKVSMRNRFHP